MKKDRLENIDKYKEKDKNYYYSNQDKAILYSREYRIKNKEEIKKKDKIRNLKNINKRREQAKIWRSMNKERKRRYEKNKKENDPVYKLRCNMSTLIAASFNQKGYKKNTKTEKILGCTFKEFKIHIEKQFKKGMSWDNRFLWHIDHRVPIATAKTESDVIRLNHFTNLQPLWKTENLRKSKKEIYLL